MRPNTPSERAAARAPAVPSSPWRLWGRDQPDAVPVARHDDPGMDATRQAHVMTLRRRIEQASYEIDHRAVAAAIVDRLLAPAVRLATGPSGPGRRSGDVLEAG